MKRIGLFLFLVFVTLTAKSQKDVISFAKANALHTVINDLLSQGGIDWAFININLSYQTIEVERGLGSKLTISPDSKRDSITERILRRMTDTSAYYKKVSLRTFEDVHYNNRFGLILSSNFSVPDSVIRSGNYNYIEIGLPIDGWDWCRVFSEEVEGIEGPRYMITQTDIVNIPVFVYSEGKDQQHKVQYLYRFKMDGKLTNFKLVFLNKIQIG